MIKIVVFCFFLSSLILKAGEPSDSARIYRSKTLIYGSSVAALYTSSSIVLWNTWYKPYQNGPFHFFNDNQQWLGMDKTGHALTSWWITSFIYESAYESGMSRKNASIFSVAVPFAYMSTIEIMDGFSTGWGFSWGDFLSNLGGTALALGQQFDPKLNQISLRYSFTPGKLSTLRPDLLGNSLPERMLKNYNEQTYWVSFPIKPLIKVSPEWLCLSLGYGAHGLLGGTNNNFHLGSVHYNYSAIQRVPEFSLSFDVDLRKIPIKGKAWKIFTSAVRWVKFPAPVLRYRSGNGFLFSPFRW